MDYPGLTPAVRAFPIVIGLIIFVGSLQEASALPQLAARYGSTIHEEHQHEGGNTTVDCRACHVNPTGGGMRNAHGREFSIQKLPLTRGSMKAREAIENAKINPAISIGFDLRFAYLISQRDGSFNEHSYFPMQADLYLGFKPINHLTIYYQDGVEEHGASASRETFVLIDELPLGSYLKFGRFIPPYGLRLADHTSYIRERLGFGAPRFGQDSGFEVGFDHHHLFTNVALVNGTGSFRDDNREKAISLTSGFKSSLFWLGGSFFQNKNPGNRSTNAGLYGVFHLWRFTLLGEWDRIKRNDPSDITGWASYGELDIELYRGIVARLKYDGTDPNQDISDDELRRITIGMDIYPYPFTEVLLQYRRNLEDPSLQNDQFIAMIHLFY